MRLLLAFVALNLLFPTEARASLPLNEDKASAVILSYQKFDESLSAETSLSTEKFIQQVEELESGNYSVLPLSSIVDYYNNGVNMPLHTVAITFDGSYRSAYEKAFPVLIKKRIPFTIFISPQLMDSPRTETLSWAELRTLARKYDFIDFGLHPFIYTRLSDNEKMSIVESLHMAQRSFDEHMGDLRDVPYIFSYPFGAYTKDYRDAVEKAGFKAAVTQSSGVSYKGMDAYQLPRFAMTDTYGAIERFRMIINAAPLPLSNWKPDSFYHRDSQTENTDISEISFEASLDLGSVDQLNCFVSGQDLPKTESVKTDTAILVTLKLTESLGSGRTRINCTMPGPPTANILDTPIYRWYGMLYSLE